MIFRKKKLFLHIGLHKTGTTSLQTFLKANEGMLRRAGYLYPRACIPEGSAAHHQLSWKMANLKQAAHFDEKTLLDAILAEQKAARCHLIISSEDFSRLGRKGVVQLKSMFRHFNVKVIVYLRRQDHRIESYYIQRIKGSTLTMTFSDYMQQNLALNDYSMMINEWAGVFGKKNMIVRAIERFKEFDSVHDFLEILDLHEFPGRIHTSRQNVSPDASVSELLRRLNLAWERKELSCTPDELQQKYKMPLLRTLANGGTDRTSYLTFEERRKLLDHFRESNFRLAREYFRRDRLFDEEFPDTKLPLYDAERMGLEEVLRLCGR